MKRNFTHFFTAALLLFGLSSNCLAINYIVGFCASGDTTTVGNVLVQNITKGTSVIVPQGDVLSLNVVSTAVNDLNVDFNGIHLSQNEVSGISTLTFYAKQIGLAEVTVFSVNGKKIIESSKQVELGPVSMELYLPLGSYVVRVQGKGYNYTSKLQSSVKSTAAAQIKFLELPVNVTSAMMQKSPSSNSQQVSMDYSIGDQLKYCATNGAFKSVLVDAPLSSKILNFTYIATANIPAGTFVMGSPVTEVGRNADEVQHTVTLSAFRMSKKEITNAQFADFLNARGVDEFGVWDKAPIYKGQILVCESSVSGAIMYADYGLHFEDNKWVPVKGYENYPAIYLSWFGAAEYAAYVGGSLPTEAQWEYACRAGTTTVFNTGDFLTNLQANYDWKYPYNGGVNTVNVGPGLNSPVGSYAPNAWGLYDMHGNNNEWCSDWYGAYPTTAVTNPTGPATGTLRVVRSGNFRRFATSSRSAVRNSGSCEFMGVGTGVRVVFNE